MKATTPLPLPQDVDLLAGPLALEPNLPSPAALPRADQMPDDADTVADPAALAGRLTGATDLRDQAAAMVAAGAPAQDVQAAVEHTQRYALLVTELLYAVDAVVAQRPDALAKLRNANTRLARLERDGGGA